MIWGKLAIISYVFSVIMLCTGFIFTSAFGWELFGEAGTQDAINTLIANQTAAIPDTDVNPAFIFGDFLGAAQAIGSILLGIATGGAFADVIGALPIFGALAQPVMLLLQALITWSTACLLINLISGRDL